MVKLNDPISIGLPLLPKKKDHSNEVDVEVLRGKEKQKNKRCRRDLDAHKSTLGRS
jgi:hypothetical protein